MYECAILGSNVARLDGWRAHNCPATYAPMHVVFANLIKPLKSRSEKSQKNDFTKTSFPLFEVFNKTLHSRFIDPRPLVHEHERLD